MMIKTYIVNIRQLEEETLYNRAAETLSPYRRQKLDLLKNENDKRRSLGAALALKAALKDCGLEECCMKYEIGEHGKPFLRSYPEICFSISHSGEYAICSICSGDIGCDIERVRSGRERVAERFFTHKEQEWIKEAKDPAEMEGRLFRIWTMKESFIKAIGLGMALPLNDCEIAAEDDKNMYIRQKINDKKYHIKEYELPAEPAYAVASAAERYKIAACSTSDEFEERLRVVVV